MAWAFATAKYSDEELFAAVGAVAQRVGKFYVQALANTAWAFAMSKQSGEQLYEDWQRL